MKTIKIHDMADLPKNFTGIVEFPNGLKHWYKNGLIHREDGPAVEWSYGRKDWFKNGKQHRLNGPATEYYNGIKEYWIRNKQISKKEFNRKTMLIQKLIKSGEYDRIKQEMNLEDFHEYLNLLVIK